MSFLRNIPHKKIIAISVVWIIVMTGMIYTATRVQYDVDSGQITFVRGLTGDSGDQGEKGDSGEKGDTGDTGDSGSAGEDAINTATYVVYTSGSTIYADASESSGFADISGTDAATVIQAALDALPSSGGKILIKKGTYTISQTLEIPAYSSLVGEAITDLYDDSYLKLDNNVNNSIIKNKAGAKAVEIRYLHLDGNWANQDGTGHGIELDADADRSIVAYCHIEAIEEDAINCAGGASHISYNRGHNINGSFINFSGADSFIYNNDATATEYGLYLVGGNNIASENNFFLCGEHGIALHAGADLCTITDNRCNHNTKDGINNQASYTVITNNRVQYNGEHGITLRALGSIVDGNLALSNNKSGIYCIGTAEKSTISDNMCIENGEYGIRIGNGNYTKVVDNTCMNNGQLTSGDGIYIDAYEATIMYASIIGNICSDDQAVPTQRNGIWIEPDTDYLIVKDNICNGNTNNQIRFDSTGTHNIVGDNIGFVTEASGTATILNGQTSVTINHGLAGTPTVVIITGEHAETSDAIVTSKTATQIVITVPAAVTADRTVNWYVEYNP